MRQRRPIARLRLVFLAVLVWLGAAAAGEAKIPRVCFLTFDPGTLEKRSPVNDGFFDGLREHGYVNGRNIDIAYLSADDNGGRYPALIDLGPQPAFETALPQIGRLHEMAVAIDDFVLLHCQSPR